MVLTPQFTCPCCGRELRVTENGAIVAVGVFLDKKPDEKIAQALAQRNLEFGVMGGETDE